jgi:3-oxoacyl-ACP reductase-like protein
MVYEESPRDGVPTSRAYVVEMARDAVSSYLAPVLSATASAYPGAQKLTDTKDAIPFVHMRCIDPYDTGARVVDKAATAELFDALLSLTTDLAEEVPLSKSASARTLLSNSNSSSGNTSVSSSNPVSFAGKVALVTGCGPGSIGIEIVKALLTGGATVIATTSRFSHASSSFFRKAFEDFSAIGSKLYLLPFNQGSAQDALPRRHRKLRGQRGFGVDD